MIGGAPSPHLKKGEFAICYCESDSAKFMHPNTISALVCTLSAIAHGSFLEQLDYVPDKPPLGAMAVVKDFHQSVTGYCLLRLHQLPARYKESQLWENDVDGS